MSKFDFSELHPLDHAVWSPWCGLYPGGRFQHVVLWWWYLGYPAFRRMTTCRIGRHAWGCFELDPERDLEPIPGTDSCFYCGRKR